MHSMHTQYTGSGTTECYRLPVHGACVYLLHLHPVSEVPAALPDYLILIAHRSSLMDLSCALPHHLPHHILLDVCLLPICVPAASCLLLFLFSLSLPGCLP
jgi:hypothetical protein